MVTYSKKFMQKFGSVVEDSFAKRFGIAIKRLWYNIRGEGAKDPRALLNEVLIVKYSTNEFMESIFGLSDSQKVYRIHKYILKDLAVKYVPDLKKWDKIEFWQSPQQTYDLRTGDCEDFTLLFMKLCELANVTSYKLRACAGDVYDDGSVFGHCYPIYFNDKGVWIEMDLTFYPRILTPELKGNIVNDKNYGEVWFAFNSTKAWDKIDLKQWNERATGVQ